MTARVLLRGALLLFLCNGSAASGAQAVFTRDGAQVYVITGPKREKLERVDLKEGRISSVALPPTKEEVVLVDLSMDAAGRLLLITANELWRMEAAEQKWTKLHAADQWKFTAVAANPKTGAILLLIGKGEGWWLIEEGQADSAPVFLRRYDEPEWRYPVFDEEGRLFVAYEADLWCGRIERDNLEEKLSLTAERCAPLAYLETENSTPGGLGIHAIMTAGDQLFVYLHRMGGSGWADLVRFPIATTQPPPVPEPAADEGEEPEVESRWARLAKLFGSVESLYDGPADAICVSPDGARVYVHQGGPVHYLIEGGELTRLKLER
jgi:hypothetical protein